MAFFLEVVSNHPHSEPKGNHVKFRIRREILFIDLATGKTQHQPTARYTDKFLGGCGLGARFYREIAPVDAKACDPANPLICVTGPASGFSRLAGPRWQIYSRSPIMQPEIFSYTNLGEKWRAFCAGWY